MTARTPTARTYNQQHAARKFVSGRRRISIYWTWSYPWESNRDLTDLDNRFSTITEVRRVAWPDYEAPEWDAMHFLQGIAGTLELFHRSTLPFQCVAEDVTGYPVAVYQRIDQAGVRQPIDERILADTDTLLIFGLDHILSEQEAGQDEVEGLRTWLTRAGTCLLVAPHHDVGDTIDLQRREVEYRHHGDPLVPRQQRFGQYTRSIMKALDIPVVNQFGLRPAVVDGTRDIVGLNVSPDLDARGLLKDVTTFNFHVHLPHYAIVDGEHTRVRVLARQPIDLTRPHPFTAAGHHEFNCLLWMPPDARRAGDIVLADSTHFTTLFGGTASLANFWRNLAKM